MVRHRPFKEHDGFHAHRVAPPRKSKLRTAEALDVAARYLVYKLRVPNRALTDVWQPLSTFGEAAATVCRAVERGWVVLRDEGQGRTKERYAALTDDGRQLARKGSGELDGNDERRLSKGESAVKPPFQGGQMRGTMALLLKILGYGWLVLGAILIVLIYSVLFSTRWPVDEDVIGAVLILLPGFVALALAAAVDRRNARRLGLGIAQGRRA
jgi:hypothetical protein